MNTLGRLVNTLVLKCNKLTILNHHKFKLVIVVIKIEDHLLFNLEGLAKELKVEKDLLLAMRHKL
jgi:hypothetical protein